MIPTLCKIGPFSIYSYGLMLAVAVLVCGALLRRDAKRMNLPPSIIQDLLFWSVALGILGARIFYVILNWSFFQQHPVEMIMLQRGGLAWQGGLVLGTVTAVVFIRMKNIPLLATLDLIAPYLALGQAIGRVGCFLNGCCYGRPVAWGIYFPVHHDHLHPTQLYATVGLFAIYVVLVRFRSRSAVLPGQVFALYCLLASIQRFCNEFFRADHETGFLSLSLFQINSILLFTIGVGLFVLLTQRARRNS